MKILGIESSCDETAAAIVENGSRILSNVVVSQIDIHSAYGGVIPEIAARSHIEAIMPVINQSLSDARLTVTDLDAIAVTHTPGLVGSLLVGTLAARTIAILNNIPFYPTHHLKSHIYANWLSGYEPEFPLLAMVISGGHTQIIYMERHDDFHIIGRPCNLYRISSAVTATTAISEHINAVINNGHVIQTVYVNRI